MRTLKLYKIEAQAFPDIHVAARSEQQAVQMYVTWEASEGRASGSFSVEPVSMEALDTEQQAQLQSLLAASTEGIAYFERDRGWCIDSDGWSSFAPGEEVR